MKKARSIIFGLAILALGIIFGGKALGLFTINVFFAGWWSLFIIIPALFGIFTDRHKLGHFILLAVGVSLLLAAQKVFGYDIAWKVMLAAAFIFIGLSIIFRNFFHHESDTDVEEHVEKLKTKNGESLTAIFSGDDKTYNKEEFTGGDIVAVFGGADLDISNAIIKKDVAIKAFCLFGGIDIKVPKNVQVKTKSGFIFGGISDDRKDNSEKGEHTIYIEASGGFGGVGIKDSKSKD